MNASSGAVGPISRAGLLDRLPTAALLLLPAALGLLVALHHEWWRDEAFTWLLVRASPSFGSLFVSLGFNGHPWPYYVLVWVLYQISESPLVLALVNLALSLGACAFLFASGPFSRLQALLFSLGFFPLFQYGVVVRTYSLFLFVLFAYCHLRARHPARVTARLLVLAALAQVHVMAMAATGLLLAFEWIERGRGGGRWAAREWGAAAAIVASLLLSTWEVVPRGGSVVESGLQGTLREILAGFANGFVPGWGIIADTRQQLVVGLLLGLMSFVILWGRWRALWLYLALSGSVAFICVAVYVGWRWHHGFYFVYLVAAIWIARDAAPARWRAQLPTPLLAVQAAIGGYAMLEDILHPYSGGEALARYREEQALAELPVVGMYVFRDMDGVYWYRFEVDQIQPVLLASTDPTAYDPKAGSFVRFPQHYWEKDYFPLQDLAAMHAALAPLAERLPAPFLIVLSRAPRLAPIELPAPITRLGEFPGLDFGETYGLYLWPAL